MVHVIVFEIGARQLIFQERRIWIGLIESLHHIDRFFRVAFRQQHVAFQPAAVEVLRVPAKNVFKKRMGLIIFLVLEGKLSQQDPARQIVRRLLGYLG